MNTCVECGSPARVKYCSQFCKDRGKRVPCACCKKPIYLGSGSRPEGKARCRPCSRAACGTYAKYKRGCRCIECRRANAEAHRGHLPPGWRSLWISPADRLAIYERDGWICQLCLEPVDPEARPLSARYPSLDHIEPQSMALIPDHRPSNLRTAHCGCNAARGNRQSA